MRIVACLVGVLALAAAAPAAPRKPSVPAFRHVLVVVFENHERSSVIGRARLAPTFNALARTYAELTQYDGVAHPSLPNYLALVSGSTQGITNDCTDCSVSATSLADTLEHAGRSWKTYAEGLPRPGYLGASAGEYAKKHDPFLYFRDVAGVAARRNRVVPLAQLHRDVVANALPSFALVVPNLCNSMHDCPVSVGDAWLRAVIRPLLTRPQLAGSVVFVIFDEGESDLGGGGLVTGLVLGPLVRRGARYAAPTDHYGLLRTIEDGFGLPALGHSATASPITGIWR